MTRRTKVALTCAACASKIPPGSVTGGDISLALNLRGAGRTTITAPICAACATRAEHPPESLQILARAACGALGLDRAK
jgi:hypothetical protein